MPRISNVKLRFTLLYGAALVATVLLFSAGIYFFVQQMLIGQINNHLQKDLTTIAGYLRNDPAGLEKLAHMGPIRHFRVRNGNRPMIASEEWAAAGLEPLIGGGDLAPLPRSITTAEKRLYRYQTQLLSHKEQPYQIVVAHEEGNYRRTLNTLAWIIMLILPVSIIISLAIGYLIAGRVLAPINAIAGKAREISAENLSARLPVSADQNEFNQLALIFNQTFSRLEDSFERLRCFTSDASHELRTPLTAIRSIGETALQQPRIGEECREVIGSMLEESDRLLQTVESLLMLSRIDNGILQKEPIEIGSLLADVVEFMSVLAEEKQQQISFDRSAALTLAADPCMLRRAFLNLIDNAIKYSPEHSSILVRLYHTTAATTALEVVDSGSGIPNSEKTRIFDRFYRIDNGRSRKRGGTGLGLSITKSAIEAHGGTINVHDRSDGGAIFRVIFPRT